MPVNLLNDKDLNNYIINLVWGDEGIPKVLDGQSQKNLTNIEYIEQNKDEVIRSIITQYMKHRIRRHLVSDENSSFLLPISMSEDLPDWAKSELKKGNKVFKFDSAKVPGGLHRDLTTIRDFLYSEVASYVDKSLIRAKETQNSPKKKGSKEPPKIVSLDYLKTNSKYETFEDTLKSAQEWHENMEKLARNKVRDEKMYQESLSGTKFIMDLPNGMKAYQLITPQALDFEGKYMGHCVGQGSYDRGVSDGSIKIYSIRDSNGEPHATLEVRGQDVYQCKGKGNRTPVQRYIPAVQGFVEAQELEIKHDMKNVGLIKQDGKYYSIYDLPDGFVVEGDLDLSGMDLKGVNLNIKVTGTLNLSRAKNIKLPKIADFSKSQEVNLSVTDLSGVKEIKWPKEKIYLSLTKNLPSVLDFSGMTEVYLRYADLSRVKEIKWPKGTIDLGWTKNLPSVLDFSETKEVDLTGTDLSRVKEIKWPKERIDLRETKNLPPVLDFSGTKEVDLSYTDLSSVKEIKLPKETIDLTYVYNLPPVLDFSGTKEVDLRETDLSRVKKIKWPINGDVLNIDIKNLPDNILKSYQLWQAKKRVNMMISKAIDKIKKGVNNINNIINNEHNRL